MLKFVRLSYDAETLYWINSENYLTRLIVEFFHRSLKHVTIKQSLSYVKNFGFALVEDL